MVADTQTKTKMGRGVGIFNPLKWRRVAERWLMWMAVMWPRKSTQMNLVQLGVKLVTETSQVAAPTQHNWIQYQTKTDPYYAFVIRCERGLKLNIHY